MTTAARWTSAARVSAHCSPSFLIHRGDVWPADRLIDDLYGSQPPPTAAKSLQAHVSRLRKALGGDGRLVTRGGGYLLDLAPDELDLDRFTALVDSGRRALAASEPEQAGVALEEALALRRGAPFQDVGYEDFAQDEISRIGELQDTAHELLFEARLLLGRHEEIVAELEQFVTQRPLRERPRAQLMLALYRSGRQAEALAAYQDARRALVEELGIDPSRALQELERAMLNQDPSLDREPAADAERPKKSDRLIVAVQSHETEIVNLGVAMYCEVIGEHRAEILPKPDAARPNPLIRIRCSGRCSRSVARQAEAGQSVDLSAGCICCMPVR